MPTKQDIGDELDLDDEDQDGDDEKDKAAAADAARQAQIDAAKETTAAVSRLEGIIRQQATANGQQQPAQKRVSELENGVRALVASGQYKVDQLEAVLVLVDAAKKDLRAELEEEYKTAEQKKAAGNLDQQCFTRGSEELEKILDGTALGDDQDFKDMILVKVQKKMQTEKDFESSRTAYGKGSPPARKDFEKAVRLVLSDLPGGFGNVNTKNKSSSANQPDSSNSRPSAHPAISKKNEVDVSKLNEYEREIYQTALNTTKNKEVALHALRTIGSKGR